MKKVFLIVLPITFLFVLFFWVKRESKSIVEVEEQVKKTKSKRTEQINLDEQTVGKVPRAEYKHIKRLHPFDQESAQLLDEDKDPFKGAQILEKKDLKEAEYINAIQLLLEDYKMIVKFGVPVGLNVEITNALLGDNPRKISFIDQGSRRINKFGELVDQWNTPYYFHAESLNNLTIRSAGVDAAMYTEDDIISTVE